MEKIILMATTLTFLSATTLVVRDNNVALSINSKKQLLQKGQKIDIAQGSQICFESGTGRVVIDGKVQLSSNSNDKCKTLAKNSRAYLKAFEEWLKQNIEKVAQLFAQTKEQEKLAVTRKGRDAETAKGEIVLKASDEYLVIKNDTWMPFSIKLRVLDSKGNEVYRDINDRYDVTLFIVPRKVLRDGYRILVTNGFGELVVDVELGVQS